MKKVIFICLLSLSFCLSKPADDQVAKKTTQPQNMNATLEDAKTKMSTEKSQVSPDPTTTEQKPTLPPTVNVMNNASAEAATLRDTKTNESQPKENMTKKDTEPKTETDNKVAPAKETENTTETKASTDNKEMKDNTSTKPEEKTEKATVTTTEKTAVTTKPTEAPKKDEDKPKLQARGFDGPSFIGGIILTLGLLAISFMGFKYYKNQTERNYHTL